MDSPYIMNTEWNENVVLKFSLCDIQSIDKAQNNNL